MSHRRGSKFLPFGYKEDGVEDLDRRSKRQRARDGAIILLEFTTIAAEGSELLKPMKVVSGALEKTLKMSRNVANINRDWYSLMKKLKFQLDTIQDQCGKLEEDQQIDGEAPLVSLAITEPLNNYASELNGIYELLYDNRPGIQTFVKRVIDADYNKELITDKTRDIDGAFQRYTIALQQFAANTINQMQQELAEFHQEFKEEAQIAHLNRVGGSNAYGNQHSQCLQGTRERTLSSIRQWANDSAAKPMFCLLDVAGSGKSTVAKHMVEEWRQRDRMIARFFFSRDTAETMSLNSFCSTVADAFAALDETFKGEMEEFKQCPGWALLSFEEQFEGLVAHPLRTAERPAILAIDALDECDNTHRHREQLLNTILNSHPTIPLLRIFATGRPELDIKAWAENITVGYTNFHQLQGGNDADVETYIRSRLQHLTGVGDRVYQVIRHAEGLFIWARIACDLLTRTTDVEGLLETLSGDISLDHLYKVALRQSIPKDKASHRGTVMVLQMILAAQKPLFIAELEQLSPKREIVEQTVNHLGSLLLYQGREDPIRLLHATFREFLISRPKAGIYHTQCEVGHHSLASGCLKVLSHHSRETLNINELDRISGRGVILLHKIIIDVYSGLSITLRSHGRLIA